MRHTLRRAPDVSCARPTKRGYRCAEPIDLLVAKPETRPGANLCTCPDLVPGAWPPAFGELRASPGCDAAVDKRARSAVLLVLPARLPTTGRRRTEWRQRRAARHRHQRERAPPAEGADIRVRAPVSSSDHTRRTLPGHPLGARAARMRSSAEVLGASASSSNRWAYVSRVIVGASRLAGHLDHARPLRDEQADEGAAQVIGSSVRHAGCRGGVGECALAPVAGAVGIPGRAIGAGEEEVCWRRPGRDVPPGGQCLGERWKEPDGACSPRR